jgi:N-acetyl-gamma-glutamylphosphate reductase
LGGCATSATIQRLYSLCHTPHGVAMEGTGAFIEKGIKVIDLGADFRLNDKAEYQQHA